MRESLVAGDLLQGRDGFGDVLGLDFRLDVKVILGRWKQRRSVERV